MVLLRQPGQVTTSIHCGSSGRGDCKRVWFEMGKSGGQSPENIIKNFTSTNHHLGEAQWVSLKLRRESSADHSYVSMDERLGLLL
jgi:hypothetical protein